MKWNTYTFIENQLVGVTQVRKDGAVSAPFQVRAFGGENKMTHIYDFIYRVMHHKHYHPGPSMSSSIEQSATALHQIITFNAGLVAPSVIDILIPITDDSVALEVIESYVASLEIIGSPSHVVLGDQDTTTVNVLDEDCKFTALYYSVAYALHTDRDVYLLKL